MLAEPIVKVMANAGMFPVADFENLGFQTTSLCFNADAGNRPGGLRRDRLEYDPGLRRDIINRVRGNVERPDDSTVVGERDDSNSSQTLAEHGRAVVNGQARVRIEDWSALQHQLRLRAFDGIVSHRMDE